MNPYDPQGGKITLLSPDYQVNMHLNIGVLRLFKPIQV